MIAKLDRITHVVAIDGPSASGKGTLARRLAESLGYAYLDTGLLYRAVGVKTERAGGKADDPAAAAAAAAAIVPDDLQGSHLRSDTAAALASLVAAIPAVRDHLLAFQRTFAAAPPNGAPGAVLDGRDIGTVVCPDADTKLFVTASLEVRADRRLKELRDRGLPAIHSDVLTQMKERDRRDSQREVAPLEPAKDATIIDTTDLHPDAVLETALAAISAAQRCTL